MVQSVGENSLIFVISPAHALVFQLHMSTAVVPKRAHKVVTLDQQSQIVVRMAGPAKVHSYTIVSCGMSKGSTPEVHPVLGSRSTRQSCGAPPRQRIALWIIP